jgi:predicted  nucleic acid-binding Zn-ribbon protein
MEIKFTNEEIKDVARAARVYYPGFDVSQFESLMELERHISDSDYLGAIEGILRLEQEKGVYCTDAVDACNKLMEQKAKLDKDVPALQQRFNSLAAEIKQAVGKLEQIEADTVRAEQQLEQVRKACVAEESKLQAASRKAESEKQRIKREVEDCRQQANVTEEEIAIAGKIKAEAENNGFTLPLMLDLSKEFASHKNAREKLVESLKHHGSLNKYLNELQTWCDKEWDRVSGEIRNLQNERKQLTGETVRLTNVLSGLQADVAYEEDIRRFHGHYWRLSWLLEELASWDQVFFMRCDNPVKAVAGTFNKKYGNARFWTDKVPAICPECGYNNILADEKIYRALNWPLGLAIKLKLGE